MCLLGEFWWLLPILTQLQYNYHICKTKNTNQKSIKRNGWWHLHLQSTFNVRLIFFSAQQHKCVLKPQCSKHYAFIWGISFAFNSPSMLNRILILEAYNHFYEIILWSRFEKSLYFYNIFHSTLSWFYYTFESGSSKHKVILKNALLFWISLETVFDVGGYSHFFISRD